MSDFSISHFAHFSEFYCRSLFPVRPLRIIQVVQVHLKNELIISDITLYRLLTALCRSRFAPSIKLTTVACSHSDSRPNILCSHQNWTAGFSNVTIIPEFLITHSR